jgi:hypothetical protein
VLMGSDIDFPNAGPRHVADMPTFAIGVYPVTNHYPVQLLLLLPCKNTRFAVLRYALLLTKHCQIWIIATHTADWPAIRGTVMHARLLAIGTVLNRAFQSIKTSVFQ